MKQVKYLLFTVLVLAMFATSAQTKMGNNPTIKDASALLELQHANKALYLTRVSLSSTTDVTTVPSPKAGMIVYNNNAFITSTTTDPKLGGGVGIYYFDGTRWVGVGAGETNGEFWRVLGNPATIDGTHFLGTTDDVSLNFRVNNQKAGRIGNSTDQSVFLGYQSGNVNTAVGNQYMGYQAGKNSTTGTENHFIGYQAGFSNVSASQNHFNGYQAGFSNLTGTANTYTGYKTGYSNLGDSSTATGYRAMYSGSIGSRNNNAYGFETMFSNSTGSYNNALGERAMYFNTTGQYNTAVGDSAMLMNSTGSYNSATGAFAMYQNTTGEENLAYGYKSMYSGTIGSRNIAFGDSSLYSNTVGNENVAIGFKAGYNNTASQNHFSGSEAGLNNNSGTFNSFIGNQSGRANTTGSNNTATGAKASFSNLTGSFNTAFGTNALFSNTNVNNTAMGYNALRLVTSGRNNISLGYNAGNNITTGINNIVIGADAQASIASISNQITIGTSNHSSFTTNGDFFPAADNSRTLGSTTNRWTEIYAVNGTINTSDARMKKNVRDLNYGLNAVLKMRPVLYDWKDNTGTDKIGFIAQELRKVVPNVVIGNESKETLGVMYSDLVPVLTKAIQERQVQIESLKQDKQTQATIINTLSEEVALLRTQYAAFEAVAERVKLLEQAAEVSKKTVAPKRISK